MKQAACPGKQDQIHIIADTAKDSPHQTAGNPTYPIIIQKAHIP
jgi:hypothetical protein